MCVKKNIWLILLCIFAQIASAQIAVTNNPPFDNEENLVTDILLGDGIDASNFSSVGFANGIGYFDANAANIGFDEGVILSTGGLTFVTDGFGAGSGISGDADLELALNAINLFWNVNNVTILEFDFVAESETVAFNYVFGSMEYTSYTCSIFNDIFGFFLSGPGISGPYSNDAVNLAYVPDPNNPGGYTNTPVAVNTINAGELTNDPDCNDIDPDFESYNIYWIDNDYSGTGWQGVNEPPQPEFTVQGITGFTVPLTAEYNGLICGETYHIKLAIADASDGALNSVVFLEANSFASPEVTISTVPNTDLGLVLDVENGVLEGCGQAAIQFDRAGDMSMDLNITLEYSGDAEYGVDYAELPTELVLPAFQEQVIIPVDVFYDDIIEGDELLLVTVTGVPVPCQENNIVQDIEIIIFDQEELVLEMIPNEVTMDCLGSANIQASISGGYAPYTYTWTDAFGTIIEEGVLDDEGILSIEQSPSETTFYNLIVSDNCLDQVVFDATNVIVQEEALFVEFDGDVLICEEDLTDVILNPNISGGIPPYNYTWFYEGVVISNQEVLFDLPGSGVYQFIAEEACGGIAGDEIEVSFIDLAPYVELISYDVFDPTLLPESCFESVLQFNVPEISDEEIYLNINLSGSAEIGLDYNMETSVVIPAGEDIFYVPISIVPDQEDEGVETIELNFPFIDVCSNWPTQFTIQVYDPPPLFVELDPELILCEEDTDTGLIEGFVNGGIGIVNYAWYYQNEVVSTDLDLQTSGLDSGIYAFWATDQCDNTSMATISYDVTPSSPTVSLSSFDYVDPVQMYEGCGYSTLTFEMPMSYSNDTIFYYNITGSSSFMNGMDINELENYIEVPAGVTSVDVDIIPILDNLAEYTETIIFEFPFSTSCVPQDNIEVYINNYTAIEINTIENQTLCAGQSLELEAEYSGGVPPFVETWTYVGNIENSSLAVFDSQAGVNSAVFTVTDACGLSSSMELLVEGVEVDLFEVTWPPNEVFACYGDNSQMNLNVEGGQPPFTFQWFLEGVETSAITPSPSSPVWNDDYWMTTSTHVIATLPPYTPYNYNYEVIITDSCANEVVYNIDVNIDDCLLPTSFSPNGDDNNDVFWVQFGDLVGPVSLEVFNRWGTLVYRSDDYTPCVESRLGCWDGTHFQRYAEECSEGIYYYVFTYSNPIYNVDSYDVSGLVEGVFGLPRERSMGSQRSGSLLLVR